MKSVAKTIAILTSFNSYKPGYSLTKLVSDQANMLARHGHVVFLVTVESCPDLQLDVGVLQIKILPEIPKKRDFQSETELEPVHLGMISQAAESIAVSVRTAPVIMTHDLIFTGWNLPFYKAIEGASTALGPNHAWYHFIHSVPYDRMDWWDVQRLGDNHSIVYPNKTDIGKVAWAYHCHEDRILSIPHMVDTTSDREDIHEILSQIPAIWEADMVQVFPVSSERMGNKGIDALFNIFGCLKVSGRKVFLLILNAHVTDDERKAQVQQKIKEAERMGLVHGQDFAFASELEGYSKQGIPNVSVRELFKLSDTFIFPTMEESFGLVAVEAAASGCLVVLNKNLPISSEIMGGNVMMFEFMALRNPIGTYPFGYFTDVAVRISHAWSRDKAVQAKVFVRKNYNSHTVYNKHYRGIIRESQLWTHPAENTKFATEGPFGSMALAERQARISGRI